MPCLRGQSFFRACKWQSDVVTNANLTSLSLDASPTRTYSAPLQQNNPGYLSRISRTRTFNRLSNYTNMPVIHTANCQGTAYYPFDWELFWIVLTVVLIAIAEALLVCLGLLLHNRRSKARWQHLRERGVVVVNGPSLTWVDSLPPRRMVSTFNLRQASQALGRGQLE